MLEDRFWFNKLVYCGCLFSSKIFNIILKHIMEHSKIEPALFLRKDVGGNMPMHMACTQPLAPSPGEPTPLAAPAGMGLQSASTAFNFDGLGRPSIATALTLTVLAADGSSTAMGVTLQPETGHVATF